MNSKQDPAGSIGGAGAGSGGSDTSAPLAGDPETTIADTTPVAGLVDGEPTTASGAVNNSSNCDITCPNVTCEANVINFFTLMQSSLKLLFSASTFDGFSSRNAYDYFTNLFYVSPILPISSPTIDGSSTRCL
jgi:hypothetical protein